MSGSAIAPFDPMVKAFTELGEKYLSGTSHVHADWELVREYPPSEKLLALRMCGVRPTAATM